MKKRNPNQRKERNSYPFSDSLALTEHLSQRAREGWLLTDFRGNRFCYEKAAPQELRYHTELLQRSKGTDANYLTERQERAAYARRCKELGWRYICSTDELHILAAQDENVPPLLSDDRQTLDALRRSALGAQLVQAIFAPCLYLFVWGLGIFLEKETTLFGNTEALAEGIFWPIAAVCVSWSALKWLRWFFGNKKRVKNGQSLAFRSEADRARASTREALLLCLVGILLAAFAAKAWTMRDGALASTMAAGALGVFAYALLCAFPQKKKRFNPVIPFFAATMLASVLALLLPGSNFDSSAESPEAPLVSQDFGVPGGDSLPGDRGLVYPVSGGGKTFLAQSQQFRTDSMRFYEIRRSAYRPIFALMQAELRLQYPGLREVPANPAWQAKKAYSNGRETAVVFEDTILIYDAKAVPSDAQIRMIAEKLEIFVRDSLQFA